jgi:hypothetical protein
MDREEFEKQLKALKTTRDCLRRRIASTGGPASAKLSLQLDEIDEEMSTIKSGLEREHGPLIHSQEGASDTTEGRDMHTSDITELTSRIGVIEHKLKEIEKHVEGARSEPGDGRTSFPDGKRRRKLVRWGLLLTGLLLLVFGVRYLLGFVVSKKQFRTMDANGVQVTLVCPRVITEGKPIHIQCLIDRVKGTIPEIIVALKRPKSGCFIMMNKKPWVRTYRFEKSPSMDDLFDLQYLSESSRLRDVFRLFNFEAIQAEVTDSKNKKLCSIRFTVQVNSLSAIIASITSGVIGLFLVGLSVAGKMLMETVIKRMFNV